MRVIKDTKNKRTCVMWTAEGFEHRLNTILADGKIPLHKHRVAHKAAIKGNFDLTLIPPNGKRTRKKVKTGDVLLVKAKWEHMFIPTPIPDNLPQVWEVDCFWPEGVEI